MTRSKKGSTNSSIPSARQDCRTPTLLCSRYPPETRARCGGYQGRPAQACACMDRSLSRKPDSSCLFSRVASAHAHTMCAQPHALNVQQPARVQAGGVEHRALEKSEFEMEGNCGLVKMTHLHNRQPLQARLHPSKDFLQSHLKAASKVQVRDKTLRGRES